MPALKYESFRSRNYEVVVDSLYGVHLICQRSIGYTTLLTTCSEGYEEYQKLKAVWRISRKHFDKLCMEHIYYP